MIKLSILVMVLISTNLLIIQARSYRPYIDATDCPLKPSFLTAKRKCSKKCRTDSDCKSKRRRCLCDGDCGRGCIKPTKKCKQPDKLENGHFRIRPFNAFGATIRYTCDRGYILSGRPERKCQADAEWSQSPPVCRSEGKCHKAPLVAHAFHDGDSNSENTNIYPIGTQLTYRCGSGYSVDGFFRSMCVGDSRWVGPRMTCSPRRCGHPGDISHGHRKGHSFVYPSRVTYLCSDGYELVGRPFRTCQSDGEWTGSLPICRIVTCPMLQAPRNGRMIGDDYTFGSVMTFQCDKGFIMHGGILGVEDAGERRCQQNGHWSGPNVTCSIVDCGIPRPFYNGYLDGSLTTYGAIIKFRCYGKTTYEGSSTKTKCLENGLWSNVPPKCWKKCKVARIANGSAVDPQTGSVLGRQVIYIRHDHSLSFKCNTTHKIKQDISMKKDGQIYSRDDEIREAVCVNGTWPNLPVCKPADCKNRPIGIRNGLVRFYSMIHGDKAKYVCNTGYKLLPSINKYVYCKYGKWNGEPPICEPVYCDYPGLLHNGQILLVGIIGRYEYRPYIKRIGQNEKIEFLCSKGYIHHGATAATCIAGKWRPQQKPKCIAKQHRNFVKNDIKF